MTRVQYFSCIIITIILGLLSREVSFIPLFIGDLLYAVMMYWIIRFFLTSVTKNKCAFIALAICFSIEILQLSTIPMLIEARAHPILRLVFGQGFLWSDFIAYMSGIIIAFLVDQKQSK